MKRYEYGWVRVILRFFNRKDIKEKIEEVEKNKENEEIIKKNIEYIKTEFSKEREYPFDIKEEINKIIDSKYNYINLKYKKNLIEILKYLTIKRITKEDPYGEEDWDDEKK